MDNRTHPRIPTDSFCRARFQVGDRVLRAIGVADLGLGGCRIHVPPSVAVGLKKRSLLEGWRFSHPALPHDPIMAEIAWFRAATEPGGLYFEAGIRFQDLSPAYASEVRNFLTYVAIPPGPAIDFGGMPA